MILKSLQNTNMMQWLVVVLVVISISISEVHSTLNLLSEDSIGGLVDSLQYVDSYYGNEVHGHWRYRVLTIGLARLVPNSVEALLQRDPTPYRRAHSHFAIVNLGFLIATGLLFYSYLKRLSFTAWGSLLGSILFLTSRVNLQSAGAPMVDVSSFFFLLLGMYAIMVRRPIFMFIAMTLGVFAKETTLLLWILVWLSDLSTRQKLTFSSIMLIGTISYLLFRFVLFPDTVGSDFFSLGNVKNLLTQLRTFFTFSGLQDWISSYYLLWIPAIYALVRLPKPILIQRWVWLIPVVIAMILLLSGNLGRILFLTFPVVIPLALISIERWMSVTELPYNHVSDTGI